MTQPMRTESGEEHGLMKRLGNSVSSADAFKNMDPAVKAKAEALKKEESRLVKARYINHRGQHERLDKPYCRWAGDPISIYHFIPGHTYEVPLGLVNEINNSPGLARRSEVLDSNGMPTKKDGQTEKLHEMVNASF